MKLIAITGSIGCGKTTIAGIVRKLGYVVFDVDAWVRRMYLNNDFVESLEEYFPQAFENKKFDKRRLRNLVFDNPEQLKKLESLTHPYLKRYLKSVIKKSSPTNDCFFIDVALLYEMKWDKYCDVVIVADVDYEIQKQRVMQRDNVDAEHFDKINNVQMDKQLKKDKADIVINTDKPINLLKLDVISAIYCIEGIL